ncbi:hypothetical protein [Rhizobium leguminosarum]|uniref:hypothetical protein n=1 Tax=Rhizobium leguminosarum TaxID=384 RepID=UPI0013E049AB|nr:hypothetical protein [Rhizobium leguminosarum]
MITNSMKAIAIQAGSVSTQAISMLRTADHCRPEPFAAMVPATPDEGRCVTIPAAQDDRLGSDKTHGRVNKYLSVRSRDTKFGYRHARAES